MGRTSARIIPWPMRFNACILIVSVCGLSQLLAQTTPPSSPDQTTPPTSQPTTQPTSQPSSQPPPKSSSTSSSSAAPDQSNRSFVRRFSGGITLTVLGFSSIRGGTNTVTNSSSVSTEYDTTGASSRIGYGLTGQVSVTDHFAVAVGGYFRKIGYQFTTSVTTITNVVEGNTVIPTPSTTSTHEDTRAHAFDFPLVLRYYGKGRHTPGPRWFVEAGGSFRDVTGIRTSLDSTDASGTLTCCTNTPTHPQHNNAIGLVVGAGLQLIDPVGIRVIPGVRYTRWETEVFDSFTTHTQRNQLEATITLSF